MTDWTSEPPTAPPTSPATPASVPDLPPPPPPSDRTSGGAEQDPTGGRGRGRTAIGIVLALIAGFSAIAGFMSFWATDEILSSSTWESTGRAVVENPAAQREIAGAVAEQIIESVGLERFVAGVLPGPLSGLSGTISDRATDLLTDVTVQVVRTEFFAGVWEQAVAAVHDQFVRAVDGSGGVTSITAKGIELELGGIVGAVQEELDRRGIRVLDSIDASRIDVSYLLIDAPGLQNVRSWVRTLRILVIVLPAVAVIGAIAAFVVGRRRSFVATALGVGGLVGAAVVGLVLSAGKARAVEELSGGVISPVTADAVVSHISSGVRGALLVSAAVALVVTIVGIVVAIVTDPARLRPVVTGLAVWGPERVGDLLALARLRHGADELSVDELLLSCHERGGVVLGDDEIGAVAVALGRSDDGELVASVRLVVARGPSPDDLHPLLDAAERWAADRSAARVVLGGGVPFALWPGIPVGSIIEQAATGRGYESGRRWTSWTVPSTFRAEPPAGVTVRRAVRDDDVTLVMVAAAARWPRRSDEVARALEHGTCHVAIAGSDGTDTVVGVATHSIARAGWTGPFLVEVDQRRRGVGRALLGQVCRDLMIAEFDHVIVGEVPDEGAVAFLGAVAAEPGESYVALERRI